MMLEPGERTTSLDDLRRRIQRMINAPNQTILVVDDGEQLVGYLSAAGGNYRRNQHCAHIVVGIRQAYVGQGLGTRLFRAIETWARANNLHRLELTVMAHNEAGIALYTKMGYEEEGIRRHALMVDGNWVDELFMAKLL